MKKSSNYLRILVCLTIVSFVVWFGSYMTRIIILYQLYDTNTNVIITNIENLDLKTFFLFLNPLILINIISFFVFLLFFTVHLIFSKVKLKREGWLFIIVVIVIITAPLELFLTYYDWLILQLSMLSTRDLASAFKIVIKRAEILSSFPVIELFLYLAVIFLVIFKPLRLKQNEN